LILNAARRKHLSASPHSTKNARRPEASGRKVKEQTPERRCDSILPGSKRLPFDLEQTNRRQRA
jgi:hypothetical protein